MKVTEVFFGIQGEGKSAGELKLFIRFSGCNLKCNFCDTQYHIKNHELTTKDKGLMDLYPNWCITGGEPQLYQKEINDLIKKYEPRSIEIETNGTIPSKELNPYVNNYDCFVSYNVSPKELRFQPAGKDTTPYLLETASPFLTTVKFVYSDKKSEKFIQNTIKKYNIPNEIIWIMAKGKTKEEQEKKAKEVWNYCIKKGYNFSPRLHVLTWGTKKGV
jgi:organic radical activating enzyme